MEQIGGIAAIPNQIFRVPFNNTFIQFQLIYRPRTRMWFIDIEVDTFIVRGLRISNVFNMLFQYQNIIDFGLYAEIQDVTEPFLITDFSTGRITLNVLSAEEVEQVNDFYESLKT